MAKQYTSIIRLFEHCGIPAGMDFNLPRTRKQMLAEFGITRKGWIEVDGFTYTRHDVFEELDHPAFLYRIGYHEWLWKSKQLLNWLETNNVDLQTVRGDFAPFWNNKDFDEFFSPYFTGPFQYTARNLIAGGRLNELALLLGYEDFIQPEDREEAFRPLRIFLDEQARLLRNVNEDNYKLMRPKMTVWIEQQWWPFFNALPHEFYDVKMEIVTRLVNIGVAVQKSHRRDCRKVSEQLVSLSAMPEELRSTIVSNDNVYSRSSSSRWGGGFWGFWLVFIIIRVIASNGCDDDNRDYRINEKTPFFNIDSLQKIYSKKLVDSNARKIADSVGTKLFNSRKPGKAGGDTIFLK